MPIRKAKSYPPPKQIIKRRVSRKVRKAIANAAANFSHLSRERAKGIAFQAAVWPLEYELRQVHPKPPKGKKRINKFRVQLDASPHKKKMGLSSGRPYGIFHCVGNHCKLSNPSVLRF